MGHFHSSDSFLNNLTCDNLDNLNNLTGSLLFFISHLKYLHKLGLLFMLIIWNKMLTGVHNIIMNIHQNS